MKDLEIEIGDEIVCPFCDRCISKIVKFGFIQKSNVKYIHLDCEHIITIWKKQNDKGKSGVEK